MKAFTEVLSGIVRVGPECDAYGRPYEYSVAFSVTDGRTAILKGLVSNGGLTLQHAAAIRRTIRDMGLVPKWERQPTESDSA